MSTQLPSVSSVLQIFHLGLGRTVCALKELQEPGVRHSPHLLLWGGGGELYCGCHLCPPAICGVSSLEHATVGTVGVPGARPTSGHVKGTWHFLCVRQAPCFVQGGDGGIMRGTSRAQCSRSSFSLVQETWFWCETGGV